MKYHTIKEYQIMLSNEDYEWIKDLKFWPSVQPNGRVYFQLADMKNRQYLHRMISGANKGQIVDHINNNPLDNRRENLRIVTKAQNARNCRMRHDNTSGYRGVFHRNDGRKKCWTARVQFDNRLHLLGSFYSKAEAAEAVEDFYAVNDSSHYKCQ